VPILIVKRMAIPPGTLKKQGNQAQQATLLKRSAD
jgi:hypothetical protein